MIKFAHLLTFLWIIGFSSMVTAAITDKISDSQECVILLHGLGRTHNSMNKIAEALNRSGYQVWNESYPSRQMPVAELSDAVINQALTFCQSKNATKIHFVTHSLGGILIRYYLQDNEIASLHRMVMISPPNKGTEIVDQLKTYKIYQFITGPVGQQLGTGAESLPNRLNPVNGEIGIIIGNSSSDPWFSWLIPGEDDGKVSVARSKLDEMKDFLVVEYGHTLIMRKQRVIEQVKLFLKNGAFDHGG